MGSSYPYESDRQVSLPVPLSNSPSRIVYLEPMDSAPAQSPQQRSGLVEYWQMLRHRKWAVVLFSLLGLGAGYLLSVRQEPIYQARTTMELQEGGGTATAILGKELGLDSTVNDAYVQTQIRILQSNTLRQRVVQRLKENRGEDVSSTSPPPNLRSLLPGIIGTAQARTNPAAASGDAVRLPPVLTNVRMLGTSRIIEILCDSSEPKIAAAFANTLAREYMDSNLEARWGSAQRTSDWLNKQLQDLRVKLEQSETQLQNYTRGSGLILANEQGGDNVQQEKLRQLQSEYSRAEADRVAKQSVYEVAMNTSADTIPQVLDNGRLGAHTTKLAEMRREMAELSTSLTSQHPRVLRLQAQINEVEATFRRERDAIVARIKNEYEQATRREKMLEDAYRKQMQAVSDSSTKAIYYGILKREVETNRRLYDELLQKVKEVGIGATLQASNVRVLDPAEPPRAPYKPSYVNNLALGLASGMLLGCLFVVTQSYVNRSLNAPGEASYYLNVPELGVIPSSDAVQIQKKLPGGDEKGGLLPLKEGANGNWTPANESVELVTWQDRPSVLAESYRSTLASILSAKGPKDRPRVILVTSVDRGEGKSTTVSNLGIALAEINQRVLLLDADLRKPHMHKIFNLPNAWGLSNLLRERISLADSPIEALVKPTEIEGLYVLPSGPGTVSIANLLYSNRMAELLERVREEFDTVLIDTPPMLHLSDARVLGRLAEGAILVIRSGRTTRDAALAAKQRLVDDGINVLGTVLNDWNPKDKNKYGYYRYSYTNDDK